MLPKWQDISTKTAATSTERPTNSTAITSTSIPTTQTTRWIQIPPRMMENLAIFSTPCSSFWLSANSNSSSSGISPPKHTLRMVATQLIYSLILMRPTVISQTVRFAISHTAFSTFRRITSIISRMEILKIYRRATWNTRLQSYHRGRASRSSSKGNWLSNYNSSSWKKPTRRSTTQGEQVQLSIMVLLSRAIWSRERVTRRDYLDRPAGNNRFPQMGIFRIMENLCRCHIFHENAKKPKKRRKKETKWNFL